MRALVKFFIILFFIGGLTIIICGGKVEKFETRDVSLVHPSIPGTEAKSPWNDYGYKKLTQFHLRYYYIFEEAIEKVLKGDFCHDYNLLFNGCLPPSRSTARQTLNTGTMPETSRNVCDQIAFSYQLSIS